jgi:hypothetical protein
LKIEVLLDDFVFGGKLVSEDDGTAISETSVTIYQSTWRNIPEDLYLQNDSFSLQVVSL